ncbi:hypothetical protein NP233_g2279 [Leucocoprinus birnbaumii]|uniref:F-box domain-containing protein n=1 Tax=Leucocoprinus birnbaumii TaxID=56174 RepID=A0AAD5VYK1_9AGAR|nr:hypothetical protein NP233_g2279 [Leucocoprinus birnbaumii]
MAKPRKSTTSKKKGRKPATQPSQRAEVTPEVAQNHLANKIPSSVLAEILHHSKCLWQPHIIPLHPLVSLSAVCHSWRKSFVNNPQFWVDVYLTPLAKYNARLFIEKSSPLHFNLTVDVVDPYWTKRKKTVDLQATAIAQHSERLRTVTLLQVEDEAEVKGFLPKFSPSKPAPNLIALKISSGDGSYVPGGHEPFSSPWLPGGPMLEHIVSEYKWISMFSSNISGLTTLELSDVNLDVGDCRKLFSGTRNLAYLKLAFTPDSNHDHNLHNFKTRDLIELPSLAYLSVQLPDANSSDNCPCVLPLLFMPNLKVLDVARGPDVCPSSNGTLAHFHPRNVKKWNSPSSHFGKVRFHGDGWVWSANAFVPEHDRDDDDDEEEESEDDEDTPADAQLFSKVIDLEWVDCLTPNQSYSDESSSKLLNVSSHRISFTVDCDEDDRDEEDEEYMGRNMVMNTGPLANFQRHPKDVRNFIWSLESDLTGYIILQLPTSFQGLQMYWYDALRKSTNIEVLYSDEVRDIRLDVREGGITFPANF